MRSFGFLKKLSFCWQEIVVMTIILLLIAVVWSTLWSFELKIRHLEAELDYMENVR